MAWKCFNSTSGLKQKERTMELTILESSAGCCQSSTNATKPVAKEGGAVASSSARSLSPLENSNEGIKNQVRERYAETAVQNDGCGCGCNTDNPFNLDSYENLDGYELDADLGLGCGIPTETADIQLGHDVLDLGSGAGVDAFVARRIVGEEGSVTGVDFTPEMVDLAKRNAAKLAYTNVSFVSGDIENLPLENSLFDRVISNCVLNLVPDKARAFSEMFRVMRPGARFTVSDIVLEGELPESILKTAEAYAGCVSGAIPHETYLTKLKEAGFSNVKTEKERELSFSDTDLMQYAKPEEIAAFRASTARVVSITVSGTKAS